MGLLEKCTPENFVWENGHAKGYHFLGEDNLLHTVIDYRVPFGKEAEVEFCGRYNISLESRMIFYQKYLQCIQREINVSSYLKKLGVNSILAFEKVEHEQDSDSVSHILLQTEQIWPITQKLFSTEISSVRALEVILRLAIVLRDINRPPACIAHRGFDFHEVYISANDLILMGGFFYSISTSEDNKGYDLLEYLPNRPANLTESYLNGGIGSQVEDTKMLARAAWNIFSGHPVDAELDTSRLARPEYASQELAEILRYGMMDVADETQCNAFRRNLHGCRKTLMKEEQTKYMIPCNYRREYQYKIDYV